VVLSWSCRGPVVVFVAGLPIVHGWFANLRILVCESAEPKVAENALGGPQAGIGDCGDRRFWAGHARLTHENHDPCCTTNSIGSVVPPVVAPVVARIGKKAVKRQERGRNKGPTANGPALTGLGRRRDLAWRPVDTSVGRQRTSCGQSAAPGARGFCADLVSAGDAAVLSRRWSGFVWFAPTALRPWWQL
jgi:hypothetical protein